MGGGTRSSVSVSNLRRGKSRSKYLASVYHPPLCTPKSTSTNSIGGKEERFVIVRPELDIFLARVFPFSQSRIVSITGPTQPIIKTSPQLPTPTQEKATRRATEYASLEMYDERDEGGECNDGRKKTLIP